MTAAWANEVAGLATCTDRLLEQWADSAWQFGPAQVIGHAREAVGEQFAADLHARLLGAGWTVASGAWAHADDLRRAA